MHDDGSFDQENPIVARSAPGTVRGPNPHTGARGLCGYAKALYTQLHLRVAETFLYWEINE
jgi:hypothetical protein